MGGKLAFGSDSPVEDPNPFHGIAAAITRADLQGQPYGGWQPQERVTREQALYAYTYGAAYAGFAEQKFGNLLPGQRADFIYVDRDIMLSSPDEIRRMTVLETHIGGFAVFKNSAN